MGRIEHEECRRSGCVIYTERSLRIPGKILGPGSNTPCDMFLTLTFQFVLFVARAATSAALSGTPLAPEHAFWKVSSFNFKS